MSDNRAPKEAGFGRSSRQRFTIPNGATGASVFRLDMSRCYSFFVIRIEDCTGFQAATSLTAQVANDDSPAQVMCDLYELNDPETRWSKVMPVTGAIQFALNHAFGSRYIKFTLSQASDAQLNIDVYGYDQSLADTDNGV